MLTINNLYNYVSYQLHFTDLELIYCLQVEKFYSLLHQSSFYGGNKETVCSLLLSILPRPGHKYKLLSESSVHVSSEVNSIRSTTKISSNKVLLLQIVVKCLHKFGGFCYMEVNAQTVHSS